MEEADPKVKQARVIVCITGMPGAGKSTIAEVGHELGFEVFRMGDDVRMEAVRRNVLPSDENLGSIMLELRNRSGPVAIASLCKERIVRDSISNHITIDGIRNMKEFLEFRSLGSAKLVAVHASPELRLRFLVRRSRSDSPSTVKSFEERDSRELSVGIGEAIALADEVIPNSGSIVELRERALRLFESLIKDNQLPTNSQ